MKDERLEEKIFTILSKELQLDMPRPVAAKRKVVNEIIALIESSQFQPKEITDEDWNKFITRFETAYQEPFGTDHLSEVKMFIKDQIKQD